MLTKRVCKEQQMHKWDKVNADGLGHFQQECKMHNDKGLRARCRP